MQDVGHNSLFRHPLIGFKWRLMLELINTLVSVLPLSLVCQFSGVMLKCHLLPPALSISLSTHSKKPCLPGPSLRLSLHWDLWPHSCLVLCCSWTVITHPVPLEPGPDPGQIWSVLKADPLLLGLPWAPTSPCLWTSAAKMLLCAVCTHSAMCFHTLMCWAWVGT